MKIKNEKETKFVPAFKNFGGQLTSKLYQYKDIQSTHFLAHFQSDYGSMASLYVQRLNISLETRILLLSFLR